jgi:hypothetical protein
VAVNPFTQLVRHGGDQVRPAALDPGPLLRAAQRDDQAAHPAGRLAAAVARLRDRVADVADGHQQLGQLVAGGQVQGPLGMPGPGRQAVVGADVRPPVAPVGVLERQDMPHVLAERAGRHDPGQAPGSPVEHRDTAGRVRDDQPVGEVIGGDEAGAGLATGSQFQVTA